MTTVFIAGPMTGYKDWNRPAFHEAEDKLNALGFDVLNPARNGVGKEDEWTHREYLSESLNQLFEADAIYLLPGWETSTGARLEAHYARACGLVQVSDRVDTELKAKFLGSGFGGGTDG